LPAFFRSEGAAQDVSKPRGDIDNLTKSPSAQNWETKNAGKMPALPRIVVAAKNKRARERALKRDSSCQPGITTNARNTRVALPGMKN
jgi:hypothetical protein